MRLWFWREHKIQEFIKVFTATKNWICPIKAQKVKVRCSQPGVKRTFSVFSSSPQPPPRGKVTGITGGWLSQWNYPDFLLHLELWGRQLLPSRSARHSQAKSLAGCRPAGALPCSCGWPRSVCTSSYVCVWGRAGRWKIIGECIFWHTCVCFSTVVKVCIFCLGPFLLRFNLNLVF